MGYSDSSSDGCWSMKRCGICLLVTAVVILIAGIAVSVALPKVIRVRSGCTVAAFAVQWQPLS